jgi:starch synthase
LKILFVSAEVAPFAKVGGLADVAGSLPKALRALGHDVRVLMPSYKMVEDDPKWRLERLADSFDVDINPYWRKGAYLNHTTLDGVPIYMVGTDEWFTQSTSSETIYQSGSDPYLFLAAATIKIPEIISWTPDVVHTNDWHTGFVPVLMRERMRGTWDQIASVFTIHNLAYQGEFGFDVLDKLALPHYLFSMDLLEFYGTVNFLKAGCVFADQVNTVSPTYAKEIQTPEYGCRLDGLMMHLARQNRLSGILNGIDDQIYSPTTDPYIPAHYNSDNKEGKAICRGELFSRLDLKPIDGAPLLGIVSRLSDQKGMNLFLEAAQTIFKMPCQVVIQGLGDEWLIRAFQQLEKDNPQHFRFRPVFDVELAQQVYAGCDGFLMPSLYEPCGLGQMIAMRYGTVPIVRATGGLKDTVHEGTNGFTFEEKTGKAFADAVRRAHSSFGVPEEWQRLMDTGMRGDYSWSRSAREYVSLYEKALEQRQPVAIPKVRTA